MVPSDISKYVIGFEALYERTLNMSDHCPVAISVNLGNVPRNFIETNDHKKARLDKLSETDIYRKYTTPVSAKLKYIFNLYKDRKLYSYGIDDILSNVVSALKEGEKYIPQSRFRENIKPFCHQIEYAGP